MLSQAYCCPHCDKFVITYTSRFNEPYDALFFGCKVKEYDTYCPYCGEKNTSGEMPPIEDVMKGIRAEYGILDSDEDEDYDFNDSPEIDQYAIENEENGNSCYDPYDWTLPESDKTVKTFYCLQCGERFKVGYMDGRKRKAFCPLCGEISKRAE